MSSPTLNAAQFIDALADGSFYDLARQHGYFNIRKIVSATFDEIAEYLRTQPLKTLNLFNIYSKRFVFNDLPVLFKTDTGFQTAWMDHGKPRGLLNFSALEDALADYICSNFGMPSYCPPKPLLSHPIPLQTINPSTRYPTENF